MPYTFMNEALHKVALLCDLRQAFHNEGTEDYFKKSFS
jgi:hypothetical protein